MSKRGGAELEKEFGIEVAEGVQALTKDDTIPDKSERMPDSLRRVKLLGKEVGIVKLADRITNLQPPPKHWEHEKISRYLSEAQRILEALSGKNEYLELRIASKIESYRKHLPI